MALVRHEMQHGPVGDVAPPQVAIAAEDLCKLMVHSIPKVWTPVHHRNLHAAPG